MRILIIRMSSLGDIILTQPIAEELRRMFPEAEICLVTKPQWAELIRLFGLDIRVMPLETSIRWYLRILGTRWDYVLDLQSKLASWLIRLLVRGRKAVYNNQRTLRLRIASGKERQKALSVIDMYYSALRKLFKGKFEDRKAYLTPRLVVSDKDRQAYGYLRAVPDKKLVALFIGAAHVTKIYPLEQWREFIRLSRNEYNLVLAGGNDDVFIGRQLASEFPGIVDLCGKLDLRQLADFIARCDAVISGDSGPMHMAAALGRPQIAIYGGTHPRLGFPPFNSKAKILCADLDCQPCSLHGLERCPQKHFNCMRSITPEMLYNTLNDLLAEQDL
jgi:heptosyltransferase II